MVLGFARSLPTDGFAGLAVSLVSLPAGRDSTASQPRFRISITAAVLVGNALEFYDFVVYAFFSVYIAKAFFPSTMPMSGILASLAIFGVGFGARPLGAIVIGLYADRRGRRPALLLTMWLIALATMLIAVLPTYAEIGIAAPALLVLCRLVQGFAYGAEVGPATAYLMETAPPSRVGLSCSLLFAGQGIAACMAGLLGSTLASTLTAAEMQEWGWRVPFLAGAALTPLAVYLRRHMPETLATSGDVPRRVIGLKRPPRSAVSVLLFTVILLGGTVANYVGTYLSTYAATVLTIPMPLALRTAFVVGGATFAFGLLGGWLSDRVGRRPVLLVSRVVCTALAVPAFSYLIANPSTTSLWAVAGLLAAFNALAGGALFAAIPESFSGSRRATAMSIVYACGVAVFGGSTQFVVAWLIQRTGDATAPGWYMLATGAVATVATLMLGETHHARQGMPSASRAGA